MERESSSSSLNSYSLTSFDGGAEDFDDDANEHTPFMSQEREKEKKKKEKKEKHGHGHGHGHGHDHGHSHKHEEKEHKVKEDNHSGSDRDIESLEIIDGSFKKEKKHKDGHKHKDGGHKHKDGHKHSHGHGHKHGHDDEHDDHDEEPLLDPGAAKKRKDEAQSRAKKALLIATVFTMIFMVLEIVGGYIAGSLAIMTDAAHLLTDVAAMLLSLVAMHLASRPANKSHTFGYHRAEILGAALSVITIWALVAVLAYEAILRLLADSRLVGEIVNGKIMTFIGIAGFFVNIIDAFILKWGNAPHGHSHSHGHSHGGGGDHHENINVRSAFIHVLGDCLQSVGVIIAALFVWIGNQITYGSPSFAKSYWNLADPIASLLFGVVTLGTTFKIMKNIVNVLMERVPDHVNYDAIQTQLESIPGVKKVHDLHIWELSLGKVSLSAHIAADEHVESLIAAQRICTNHSISHVTIQIDHPMAPCETTTIH